MTDTTDPIPATGAPHAWIAVTRTHSPHADRPEWGRDAIVIPEWDHAEIDYRRSRGDHLIPIGPDGDTGTRAVVQPYTISTVLKLYALPSGSVVSRGRTVWQLADRDYGDPDDPTWEGPHGLSATTGEVLAGGPVTVLLVPTEEAGR